MPLPFTNVWNPNLPPDTGLVLQGAAELRKLRLDVQQRMAAISGHDAQKPDFTDGGHGPNISDWLGILYFAIDTGRIYQFNPPSTWLDVTDSFVASGGGGGGAVIGKDTVGRTVGASTAETTIFTTQVPPLAPNSILRITCAALLQAITVSSTFRWRLNGAQAIGWSYGPGASYTPAQGYMWFSTLYMMNRGFTNVQIWTNQMVMSQVTAPFYWTGGPLETQIETGVQTTLTFSVQDVQGGNTQYFPLWMVEQL